MLPCLVANSTPNSDLADAEVTSQLALRNTTSRITSSDFDHPRFGEPGQMVMLSARPLWKNCTPLLDRVPHVFQMGADEQMVWVYAPRNVAAMTDLHSLWDWSIVELPGKTVCGDGVPFGLSNVQCSIPVRGLCSCPDPALTGCIHFRPEAFFERLGVGMETFRGAEDALPCFLFASFGETTCYCNAAVSTGDHDRLRTHRNLPCSGAAPGGVTAPAGFCCA